MVSAVDLITYIGVPLTVAGVIPLFWNMIKALRIRRRLLKQLPMDVRPFCDLIADPAAGTVTVVAKTPKLAQPGLWFLYSRSLSSDGTVLPAADEKERPDSKKRAIMTSQLSKMWKPFTDRDKTTARVIIMSGPEYRDLRRSEARFRMSRTISPWMGMKNSWPFALALRSKYHDEIFGRYLGTLGPRDQRYIVDIDMRTEPMLLAMTWAQFIWFALTVGVSPYSSGLLSLLHSLAATGDGEVKQPVEQILRDRDGHPLFRMTVTASKLVAQLYERRYTYDLRTAMAAEHIMLYPGGTSCDVETYSWTAMATWCRSLNSDNSVEFGTIQSIDRFGFNCDAFGSRPGYVLPEQVVAGCSLRDIKDPLAAAFTWATYDNIGPVSEELREVRARCVWQLHSMARNFELAPFLKIKFPEGDLAKDIQECLAETIRSSAYVDGTQRLLESWSNHVQELASISKESTSGKNKISKDRSLFVAEKWSNAMDRFREDILKSTLPKPSSPVSTPQVERRQELWGTLRTHPVFAGLRDTVSSGDLSTMQPNSLVLKHAQMLIRIFLALTTWDNFNREVWEISGNVTRAFLLVDYLHNRAVEKHPGQRTVPRHWLEALPSPESVFANGGFEAPISFTRKVFGQEPELKISDEIDDIFVF